MQNTSWGDFDYHGDREKSRSEAMVSALCMYGGCATIRTDHYQCIIINSYICVVTHVAHSYITKSRCKLGREFVSSTGPQNNLSCMKLVQENARGLRG